MINLIHCLFGCVPPYNQPASISVQQPSQVLPNQHDSISPGSSNDLPNIAPNCLTQLWHKFTGCFAKILGYMKMKIDSFLKQETPPPSSPANTQSNLEDEYGEIPLVTRRTRGQNRTAANES